MYPTCFTSSHHCTPSMSVWDHIMNTIKYPELTPLVFINALKIAPLLKQYTSLLFFLVSVCWPHLNFLAIKRSCSPFLLLRPPKYDCLKPKYVFVLCERPFFKSMSFYQPWSFGIPAVDSSIVSLLTWPSVREYTNHLQEKTPKYNDCLWSSPYPYSFLWKITILNG